MKKELSQSNVKHTLPNVVAGDLTYAISYRTIKNIKCFLLRFFYCALAWYNLYVKK